MSFLIDDVARIMASPLPRRKALKLLGSTFAGAVWAAVSVQPARAQCSGTTRCPDVPNGKACRANTPCETCPNCCCNLHEPADHPFDGFDTSKPDGVCVIGVPCGGQVCCAANSPAPVCCPGAQHGGWCCPAGTFCGKGAQQERKCCKTPDCSELESAKKRA